MKTYLKILFSSEGRSPSEVKDLLLNMGFKANKGNYDFVYEWDEESRKGFKHIPYKCRVPIKTAANMYRWTAKKIENNPMIVFDRKVKPTKFKILSYLLLAKVSEKWN